MNGDAIDRWFPFPLDGSPFELPFGVKVLRDHEPILIASESFEEELRLKQRLYLQSADDYFQADPQSLDSQVEAAEYLRGRHPEWSWADDGRAPLLATALQVQEDLVLLRGKRPHQMIAGAVFFPSGWCVGDKVGLSLQQIHSVVPGFQESLERQTDRLVTHLKLERPVWRLNWGVRSSDQLDQSPKWSTMLGESANRIDESNALSHCYFRVERQTLARLPGCGDILFTIHTRQWSLKSLAPTELSAVYKTLLTCPQPTLTYKGIDRFYKPLINCLARRLGEQGGAASKTR